MRLPDRQSPQARALCRCCGTADIIIACKSGTLARYFSSCGPEVPVLGDFAAVSGGLNIAS